VAIGQTPKTEDLQRGLRFEIHDYTTFKQPEHHNHKNAAAPMSYSALICRTFGFTMRIHLSSLVAAFLLLQLSVPPIWAAQKQLARIELPALQTAKLRAEDAINDKSIGPFRYGVTVDLSDEQTSTLSAAKGNWTHTADGKMQWTGEVYAKAAKSLEVIAHPFRLPDGAELNIYDQSGKHIWGPFDSQENNAAKTFPSPIVAGELIRFEITVPIATQPFVEFDVDQVKQGYRSAFDSQSKLAGGCNVDVICPQGNAYRDEIRSVVAIYLGNSRLCTGTWINNTRQDRAPLLLTADHCRITTANAAQIRVYYNYQSATCRPISAGIIPQVDLTSGAFPTSAGFSLLARSEERADFSLLRLNGTIPAAANVHFMGWDRTDTLPSQAIVIHHPQVVEKRISQSQGSLRVNTQSEPFTGGRILPAGTAIDVPDYSFGTTEEGSSGSALFSASTRRIVGTLSGGSAACLGTSNQGRDLFGRLFTSWTGEGTSSTRLSDHLDPINSNVTTLDAAGSCTPPVASITNAAVVNARDDVNFTVNSTGGVAPFSYSWDVDGDGVDDRTTTTNTLAARYDKRGPVDVRVKITDGAGCSTTVTKAINVLALDVSLTNALPAQQICGNNDAAFDPGERWRIRTEMQNTGANSTAGIAQFSSLGGSSQLAQADAFGYSYSNQTASCRNAYIDLSSVTPLTITAASGSNATDDGQARIGLGTNTFDYYGENVNAIAMSTNGYLVVNPSNSVSGADFRTINCNNQPETDAGRRIRPLHRDLQVTAIRAAAAANCPRAADVGAANQRCLIFDWAGVNFLAPNTFTPSGLFDMQAIVYPDSRQIVFQYRGNLPSNDLDLSVAGLMNTTTPAYNFMCKDQGPGRVAANTSVCFFHPSNQPAGGVALELSQGAPGIGNLATNQTGVANVEMRIPTTAACGSSTSLSFIAAIDDRAASQARNTVNVPIAQNCSVVNNCPLPASIRLKSGGYHNPNKSGNGIISFVAPQPAPALPLFVGNWFTGLPNRQADWYVISGTLIGNNANADILRVTRGDPTNTATQSIIKVGTAQVNLLTTESYALSYQFTSGPNAGQSGAEIIRYLYSGLPTAVPDISGIYYSPSDSGWGMSISSFVFENVPQQLILTYLYDTAGEPRWVIGDLPDSAPNGPVSTYSVHCPGCAWIDFFSTREIVGTQSRSFPNGFGRGRVQTQITLKPPLIGTWNRGPLDFFVLTANPNN
jgi:lysyl endopeptidase